MRKIINFVFVLLFLFVLCGCKKDDTTTINEEKEDSEDEGITVNYGGKKFSEEEIKQMITEKEGKQDEKE